LPGIQADGNVLLSTQWSLRPAGRQVDLGNFPVNVAVHPKGTWAAVLHAGFAEHEIVVVDIKRGRVHSRVTLPQTFYGICFDPEGSRLFASGCEAETIHQFQFADGYLSAHREISIATAGQRSIPGGLATDRDGTTLYAACCWGDGLVAVPLGGDGSPRRLALPKDSYPYVPLPASQSERVYVSLWGKSGVAVVDRKAMAVEAVWTVASHPTEMALSPDETLLYVACSDTNTVSVVDTKSGKTLEVIGTALFPQAPHGSTPSSLALSPGGKALLVANSNNNDVAVIDISRRGQSQSLGFIPAGWYPTAVRFDPAGETILIVNAKGIIPKANPHGPNPMASSPVSTREYIGGLLRGTLSILHTPGVRELARYSQRAYECSPLRADPDAAVRLREPGHPIPARSGEPSPIKHCIYIIKENRTYDQVLGDLPQGNGDPDLCIFPEQVTPNHHALVRQFVLLDNFYVEAEVSATGHEWSTAAYATDFVERTWPLNYRGGKGNIVYPGEGGAPLGPPSSGYLWDRCREAGLSYRSYGEFIANGKTPSDPGRAKVKSLEGHFDPFYRGFDLNYPDARRADRFLEEFKRFEADGNLPRFVIMHLPSDHTHGTRNAKLSPTAMVADNDLALGRIVEAVSRSRYWPETAVFVVEDDAQNGSDHVDAHRSVALVISPYVKRRSVDSNLYSTSSLLRTMELILGLKPMTQFDAAALPMDAAFQAKPDLSPYICRPAQVSLDQRNGPTAWGADLSEKMDFSEMDAADDLLLNEIVWKSVRGPDSAMPPPVRAAFVRSMGEKEEER
jgi:YVTN family beta-propeller protein